MRVKRLSREEFVSERFDYQPGEHVQIVSPTGGGKTELAGQLAEVTLPRYPELRYVSLMPKPEDDTASRWAQRLDLKVSESWPPRRQLGSAPRGHVFRPRHIKGDPVADKAHLSHEFGRALSDLYWDGSSITFADDAYLIGVTYGLNPYLDQHWIAGRSNKAGLWTALQKPSGTTGGAISSFGYNQPTHMFFGRDNAKANLEKIAEISISQIDPAQIIELVKSLPVQRFGNSAVSEMLYIDRRGPYMCQVGI